MTKPHVHDRVQAKKAFGQNFLVNPSAVAAIVGAARACEASRFLEIGPGMGALTEQLLADGRPLTAVELDPEACAFVSRRFAECPHFSLLPGDAAQVALPPGEPWSVVGNLPYNAATAILTRFLLEEIPWSRMVFMFQLEVGLKLMGRPGEKAYGPLSILAQRCTTMTRLLKLGPGSFNPAPKVDSAVLLFEPKAEALPHDRRRPLLELLHRSFAHRRKTLANNWTGWLEPAQIREILEAEDLPPAIRAEAISPKGWERILERLET